MSPCSVLLWLAVMQVPEPPPPEPALHWVTPPGCPDRAALLQGITRRRGRPLAPGDATVDARVARQGPRYVLRLQVRAGVRSEQRELAADSCAALADATALLVALAVDATTSDPPAPLPGGAPLTPPAAAPPTALPPGVEAILPAPSVAASSLAAAPSVAPAPPVAPTRVPDRRPGALVRLHGGPELGAVPGLSGAVGLGLGLLWPRLRLELQGTFVAPRGVQRTQGELQAWLLAAAVHVCARPGRGALEFPLCGGLELGGMRGSLRGPELARAGDGLWLGGVLGAGVAWRFHPRLAVWAALQGLLAVRPSFRLDDPNGPVILFEPPPVSGRLLLGLELRIRDRR